MKMHKASSVLRFDTYVALIPATAQRQSEFVHSQKKHANMITTVITAMIASHLILKVLPNCLLIIATVTVNLSIFVAVPC
jgi:hypothetical protein